MPKNPRTICYVTGTRAEFGLMQTTLRAIQSHRALRLQLIATGMHLDPAHGKTIRDIRKQGFSLDATIPWKPAGNDLSNLAHQTAQATAKLATAFANLNPDIVLVTGDRVEAFAAATAAHLSGKILAHVHGGDRALGQIDDSLRHAITKLAHLHFPATKQSAARIARLGEDKWRIQQLGSPGIDGITRDAAPFGQCREHLAIENNRHLLSTGGTFDPNSLQKHRYALLLLHPTGADDAAESRRAAQLLAATESVSFNHVLILYPNNDPGSTGILACWDRTHHSVYRALPHQLARRVFIRNLPRPIFLSLLRHAAVLIGNSSSGIIEAASFGTPVLDIGPRQQGRERGPNVTTVPFTHAAIQRALKKIWNNGRPKRHPAKNPYGAGNTAKRIAQTLANVPITDKLRRKLITY
jgi:UDP-N-acetylglucosamine 2-epimerase (non-hydrolysing)/GDP/UDP-N,N'-diacetylbacillosamine 2-epimerase (hydrolysing)